MQNWYTKSEHDLLGTYSYAFVPFIHKTVHKPYTHIQRNKRARTRTLTRYRHCCCLSFVRFDFHLNCDLACNNTLLCRYSRSSVLLNCSHKLHLMIDFCCVQLIILSCECMSSAGCPLERWSICWSQHYLIFLFIFLGWDNNPTTLYSCAILGLNILTIIQMDTPHHFTSNQFTWFSCVPVAKFHFAVILN